MYCITLGLADIAQRKEYIIIIYIGGYIRTVYVFVRYILQYILYERKNFIGVSSAYYRIRLYYTIIISSCNRFYFYDRKYIIYYE